MQSGSSNATAWISSYTSVYAGGHERCYEGIGVRYDDGCDRYGHHALEYISLVFEAGRGDHVAAGRPAQVHELE